MTVNRSAPRATVVPILVYEDVGKAIDWLCDTFGFRERLRAGIPGGSVTHAQLDIAEGAVMLGRQGAEFRPPRANEVSQYVTVHVADVDKHFEHARQCGASHLEGTGGHALRRAAIHGGGPRGAQVDVLPIHR